MLKENIETFIASLGCTFLTTVSLFLLGGIIGTLVTIPWPIPPRTIFVPIVLLPIFVTLYLRAYRRQQKIDGWLGIWQTLGRKRLVGQASSQFSTVEELWLENQVRHRSDFRLVKGLLDNVTLWAWASGLGLLSLAYFCLQLGVRAALGT